MDITRCPQVFFFVSGILFLMKARIPFIFFVLGLCVTYGSVVFSAPAFGPGEYLDPPCAPGTTYLGDDCTTNSGWQFDAGNNFVFNTTDDIGIGTSSPTTTLDVRGDFITLFTAPDDFNPDLDPGFIPDIDSDSDGVGLITNGDLSTLGGHFGTAMFVADNILAPTAVAYQRTNFNYGDPEISMSVSNDVSNLDLHLVSATGEIQLEAGDIATDANSYLELHMDGQINLNSNPCHENYVDLGILCPTGIAASFLEMEMDGDLELYSVADMDINDPQNPNDNVFTEFSSLVLENNAGSSRLLANVTNSSDINSRLILDPGGYSLFEVDDQDDDGAFGISFNSNNSSGGSIYHIRSDIGLDDVVTYYWPGQIWHSVTSDTQFDIDGTGDSGDKIDNIFRQHTGGFDFTYQVGSGTLSQSAESSLSINNDFDWAGDSSSFTSTVPIVDSSGVNSVNSFITDITSTGNAALVSYQGLSSILTYTGDYDLTGTALSEAPLIGINGTIYNTGAGTISEIIGGAFNSVQYGSGVATELTGTKTNSILYTGDAGNVYGARAVAANYGTGDITGSAYGLQFRTVNNNDGDIDVAYGIQGTVSNQSDSVGTGAGIINYAYAANLGVYSKTGAIGNATGILLSTFSYPTGSIMNATGIQVSAGTFGDDGLMAGIEATNTAVGISLQSDSGRGAIEGDNVYGIYFEDDDTLLGTSNEYALYIGDTDAENWFSNGFRIGTNSDDNKIDSETNGSGSNTLYIGTNTIDTTAPSDERTKQDITSTVYGLDDLNQIDVVDFVYDQSIIDDHSKQHTGVLAQQVESIYPEAVSRRSDGYLMVDYKTFIPLIIKSIQDLRTEVVGMFSNFVTDVFTARRATVTEEFCVGSVCVNEAEFGEIVDQIRDNEGSDDSSGSEDNSDDQGGDEDVPDEGSIPDENVDPVPEPDSQEDVEDGAEEYEEGQSEPLPEPGPEPESVPDESGEESAPIE